MIHDHSNASLLDNTMACVLAGESRMMDEYDRVDMRSVHGAALATLQAIYGRDTLRYPLDVAQALRHHHAGYQKSDLQGWPRHISLCRTCTIAGMCFPAHSLTK